MKGRVRNQYLATICVNIASFVYGLGLGWASPNVPLLLSPASSLVHGPVTLDQSSWIISLFCIGGFIGGFVFRWMLNRFGRKWCIVAIGVPELASWMLIAIGRNVECIYVARFLIGIAGRGVVMAIPVFVSEISSKRLRGVLGFVFGVACCCGTLVTFVLRHYSGYVVQPLVAIVIAVVFVGCMLLLPDTPRYLLIRERVTEARAAICFYRQWREEVDGPEIDGECARLRREHKEDTDQPDGLSRRDWRVATTRRGIFLGVVLIAMTQLSGSLVIINYTASIFADAGSTWHPNESAMVIALLQVFATVVFINLIDRVGRKVLILSSGAATSVALATLGGYFYAKSIGADVSEWNWLPLVSLSIMMFVVIGVYMLPFVLVVELLPPHLISTVPSYLMLMLWVLAFLLIKYFNSMVAEIQMHGCMWLFAGCCAAEVLILAIWMPETKGRHYEEIRMAML